MPNDITISDATEWECAACGAHTYVEAKDPPPENCWACGKGPLRPSADLHVSAGEANRKVPREQ